MQTDNTISSDTVQTISSELMDAERECESIEPLSDRWNLTPDHAYQIQLAGIREKIDNGARVTGKKIGLTSKGMQDMLGVTQPDYGHLLDTMAYTGGEVIPTNRFLYPRIEAEIGFLLGEDIAGPNVTTLDVLEATEAFVPTMEIIDSRIHDWNVQFVDTVSDNASSGAYVVGSQIFPTHSIDDIRLVGMVHLKNGRVVQTGAGAATLGNPAYCVAWLANTLHQYGITLDEGELILSGAIAAAEDVESGDFFEARFGGLGRVSCEFA